MTITFVEDDVMSVVQEVMVGMILDSKVSLNGVSYTNIHQGASESYDLDAFELHVNSNADTMKGKFVSTDEEGEVILIRELSGVESVPRMKRKDNG